LQKWGYYKPIFDSVIGAVVMRAGYGSPYGESKLIPIDKRFFTGGANSIRGFVEDTVGPKDPKTGNPTGGNILLNLTLEARAPLWGLLGLALFTDWGNVWEDEDHFELSNFRDVRKSAGLGLRYLTPIGPLRIDLGFKLDRQGTEPLVGFHFFIGNVF
jgi:outer membrane protein insertion porin family